MSFDLGLDATNPVFGVSDKRNSSQSPQLQKLARNLLVASLDMILSNKRITKMLIRLGGCAGWSLPSLFTNTKHRFSCVQAHYYTMYIHMEKI